MGIESLLVFIVLLASIGSTLQTAFILRDIEIDIKTLIITSDKTNERLDRLINTAQTTIYQISKSIDDIQKK